MSLKCKETWARTSIVWFMALSTITLEARVSSFSSSDRNFTIQKQARRELDDIGGDINIDCGKPDEFSYHDDKTELEYKSDGPFINTGVNKNIPSNFSSGAVPRSFMDVRSFPQGTRNCYTLKPPEGKARIYLIRASFMYGNYDNQDRLPRFDLYVGVNKWDSVKFDNASHIVIKEIIHIPVIDNIYVCLLNTGSGTPFISALEVRHYHNSTYQAEAESASLDLYQRLNFGSTTNEIVRFPDDVYDRIWTPYDCPRCTSRGTNFSIDSLNGNVFNLPSKVMRTAALPINVNDSLHFEFDIGDPTLKFYIYMHFAELQSLQGDQYREFNITLNGNLLSEVKLRNYLHSMTILSPQPVRGANLSFSLYKSEKSTLPPILNAMEIYIVRDFLQAPTDEEDVSAIEDVKSNYGLDEGWQGDPCAPVYPWNGLNCSYNGYEPPRITSLNLSTSKLTGPISSSLSRLKLLQHLDLANNGLTGPMPEFLAELTNLRTLNLEGNKLSGSVPLPLIERYNNGSLILRVAGNPSLCLSTPCNEEKKKSIVVPVVATVASLLLAIFIALVIFYKCKRKEAIQASVKAQKDEGLLIETDSCQFTYLEIIRITNSFQTVIGKGGFGTVYHGYLVNGTPVAVKMLSPGSVHGSTQFQTEAHLLMRIHHRNLASFIGYCNEGTNIGIVYEYMAGGNLEQYLLDKRNKALSWKDRLQIALDAAQGLQYLHQGCKPPIVHRDVKSSNILLDEKLQAKIADFGLSKLFPSESRSHMSTEIAGTVGYVDPEYYASYRLTEKSDVYSFGVVLLELITGRPAIIKSHDENIHIVHWISSFLANGDIRNAVDPRLNGNFDINSLWKFVEIAMSCVPSISIQRPTMSHIVRELKECLEAAMAREQIRGVEGQSMRSSNSFEMSIVHPETEMGPEVR